MLIEVKLYATLRRYAAETPSGQPCMVELTEGATLQELVDRLGIPPEETRVVFVNGRAQEMDYTLQPGDQVGIFPPIGGG
jgi:molybdopterin converting factor small subunit